MRRCPIAGRSPPCCHFFCQHFYPFLFSYPKRNLATSRENSAMDVSVANACTRYFGCASEGHFLSVAELFEHIWTFVPLGVITGAVGMNAGISRVIPRTNTLIGVTELRRKSCTDAAHWKLVLPTVLSFGPYLHDFSGRYIARTLLGSCKNLDKASPE